MLRRRFHAAPAALLLAGCGDLAGRGEVEAETAAADGADEAGDPVSGRVVRTEMASRDAPARPSLQ